MIKHSIFLFISFFCILFNSFSQKVVSDNFNGLSPEGNIPEIFRQATIDIAKQGTVSAVNIKDSWKIRNEKQDFFLESSFFFSRIMHSGMILFGDPVTVYLNQVKDALLKEHPSLKDEITIYATKSPYVNAFATPYGVIFINAGLVAQVENEAQLAYIIAHEIIHYVNNHALNMHIEKETTRGWLTSDKNQNEDIFKYHHRSKEMEMEADNLGFLYYYRNSGYDLNEVLQVFDVLLYSYLPFDEVKWDPKYYATKYYSIDTAYLTKKITPITAEEDYDDRESTHPNVKNRKASLEDALLTAAQDNIERKKFLVSEEEFFYIRDLCRLESIRQHVINGDYIQALYNAQIVNASYPSHQVIEDAVAYSLYALGKIRSNTYKGEIRFPDATNFEGEISATYHCFNNMPSEELIGLSLRKSWHLSKQYPEKTFYQQVTKYALEALVAHNNFNINNYRFQTPDSLNIMKQKYLENLDTLNMTKLDKIKMQKMLESFNYNNENSLIFCDIEDKQQFKELMNTYNKLKTEDNENIEYFHFTRKKKDLKNRKIDSMVVLEPDYVAFRMTRNRGINVQRSLNKRAMIVKNVIEAAQKTNIDTKFLMESTINKEESDNLKYTWKIKEFISESMNISDSNMLAFSSQDVSNVYRNTNYQYAYYPMIFYVKKPKVIEIEDIYCFIPYGLINLLAPTRNEFLYYNILLDMKNGKILDESGETFMVNHSHDFLSMILYSKLADYKEGYY